MGLVVEGEAPFSSPPAQIAEESSSQFNLLSTNKTIREILVSRKTPGFCAEPILEDGHLLNS
jgi:hypothetical protein